MTQKEFKQLYKLMHKFAAFVDSGRHNRPDEHYTDEEAKKESEPLAAQLYRQVAVQINYWIE